MKQEGHGKERKGRASYACWQQVYEELKARNADYNAAEKILMEQAPIAPIYQYTNGRLIKPWLKGYPINNPEDVAYSRTMYIVKH